jgi:hypothetical protein
MGQGCLRTSPRGSVGPSGPLDLVLGAIASLMLAAALVAAWVTVGWTKLDRQASRWVFRFSRATRQKARRSATAEALASLVLSATTFAAPFVVAAIRISTLVSFHA